MSSDFFKSIITLASGTLFAQIITLVFLPILTRFYTPDDFNVLAVFASIVSLFVIVCSFRLEIALPTLISKPLVQSVIATAIFIIIINSLLSYFIVFILWDHIFLVYPEISIVYEYISLIPIGIFFISLNNLLLNLTVKKGLFKVISKTRFIQALIASCIPLFVVMAIKGPGGLILGFSLSGLVGVISYSFVNRYDIHTSMRRINLKKLYLAIRKCKRFVIYSTPEAFANSASIHIPIIIIGTYSLNSGAGYLILAMKVLQAPLSMLGNSIAQVYLSKAAVENKKGKLTELTFETILKSIYICVIPLTIVGLVAPNLFLVFFGKEWGQAGVFVQFMMPWFIIQVITTPISMVMHVTNKQLNMLFLTLVGLILKVGITLYFAFYKPSIIVEAYALSSFMYYLLCFLVFSATAGIKFSEYKIIISRLIIAISLGLLFGYIINYIFKVLNYVFG